MNCRNCKNIIIGKDYNGYCKYCKNLAWSDKVEKWVYDARAKD